MLTSSEVLSYNSTSPTCTQNEYLQSLITHDYFHSPLLSHTTTPYLTFLIRNITQQEDLNSRLVISNDTIKN